MPQATLSMYLALDVGERRIGVAKANGIARIASPLTTLERSADTPAELAQLLKAEGITELIVGLPRNLNGEATNQTRAVEQFVAGLHNVLAVPVHWQDEALTSRKAEAELEARGKPYQKGDIDALSATYILEDFLRERLQGDDV